VITISREKDEDEEEKLRERDSAVVFRGRRGKTMRHNQGEIQIEVRV